MENHIKITGMDDMMDIADMMGDMKITDLEEIINSMVLTKKNYAEFFGPDVSQFRTEYNDEKCCAVVIEIYTNDTAFAPKIRNLLLYNQHEMTWTRIIHKTIRDEGGIAMAETLYIFDEFMR
jgi:hypothetical protein